MSKNVDNFLFLEFGIFSLKLGKKHTFGHWEHDQLVPNMDLKKKMKSIIINTCRVVNSRDVYN